MFSTLRTRFGIPGVISVIALVFAMLGGAFAANNLGSSGNGATASAKKALKGPRGPRGPKGATGAAGPAGPAGPAGAKGDTGATGANGQDGVDGTNGISAKTKAFTGSKGSCSAGGIEVESASPTVLVCNGAPGLDGETGFTETLPSGKTETGVWGSSKEGPGFMLDGQKDLAPASFSIPVSPAPTFKFVPNSGIDFGSAPGCPGVSGGMPQADPGNFCVYGKGREEGPGEIYPTATVETPAESGLGAVSPAGFLLSMKCTSPVLGACYANGVWAVTG